MTNIQLYLAIGVPILSNALLLGLVITYINAKFDAVAAEFRSVDHRFTSVDRRFDEVDRRFDETRDLWRSEIHRVEAVIDARLRQFEAR